MKAPSNLRSDLPPGISPDRQKAFDKAVLTALYHIPITNYIALNPDPSAIVDHGNRFAVYGLNDLLCPHPPGSVFPAGRCRGTLVATVDLDGFLDHVTPPQQLNS